MIHPNNWLCANGHIHWSLRQKLLCEKGKPMPPTEIDRLRRERDQLLKALDRIVEQDLSTVDSERNAKLLLAIAIAYELLAKLEKRNETRKAAT